MKKLIIILLPFLMGAGKSIVPNIYPCEIIKISDADTYICNVYIDEFDIVAMNRKIRASEFDTCESSRIRQSVTITDEELKRGKEATLYIQELTKTHYFYLSFNGKDVYGRHLCIILLLPKQQENSRNFINLKDLIFAKGYDRSQL